MILNAITSSSETECRLIIANNYTQIKTDCFKEDYRIQMNLNPGRKPEGSVDEEEERTVCDIKCDGADRDSVISKVPNSMVIGICGDLANAEILAYRWKYIAVSLKIVLLVQNIKHEYANEEAVDGFEQLILLVERFAIGYKL
ncbi:unnamed protein product [Anisakis simplex]|uniref:Flavin-containing monooxygenase n=1 Tax=Anisakis simplex TaxID=6269 RepID=A0A0M3K6Q8_ANISI|nr:unnamed protein product [Anisakis simplex]